MGERFAVRQIQQGRLFPQGIRLESSERRLEIPWQALKCAYLARVQPTRQTLVADPGSAPSFGAGLVGKGGQESRPTTVEEQPYMVVDLYADGVVCRLNNVSTNLRSFLGEQAGYSGEVNLLALVARIGEAAPHSLSSSVKLILEKGRSLMPSYPDAEAFRAGSRRAFGKHLEAATADGPPPRSTPPEGLALRQETAPSSTVPGASHRPASPSATKPRLAPSVGQSGAPSPRSSLAPVPAEPGLAPFFLTSGYIIGLFFILLGGWATFLKEEMLLQAAGYWLGAGLVLTLTGLGTIKARKGTTRPYLEANLWLLRLWFVLAGLGFVGFGIILGVATAAMYVGIVGSGVTPVSMKGVKMSAYVIVVMACVSVASVIFVLLGLNMLFLSLGTRDHLLNSRTLLDFLNIS